MSLGDERLGRGINHQGQRLFAILNDDDSESGYWRDPNSPDAITIDGAPLNDYPEVCERHCTLCEGNDHHWMPDYDEELDPEGHGEMWMACKHCEARREIGEDEEV
mgnify:CR=1 FL=1